jgi:hypothetical protein
MSHNNSNKKRKLEEDDHGENKKQKIEDNNNACEPLPNELFIHVLKSAGFDQVLVVALLAMTSTLTRAVALYMREKYEIPTLTFCNVQIKADSDSFFLTIPKHLMTLEELFLLKCATKSIFYNYLEFREWSLSYTVAGWIYHKYTAFATRRKHKSATYYKLLTEVMSGGIYEGDPSPSTAEKTYYWCVLREQELRQRGWTWEAKKWNGFASCQFNDTNESKALLDKRKKEKKPPVFFTLDVPEEQDLGDENESDNLTDAENDSHEESVEEDMVEDEADEQELSGVMKACLETSLWPAKTL